MDGKSYQNILIHEIWYKSLIAAKPLRLRFDKVDGFIRVYDGTRFLVLFSPEKCNAIFNKIKYITSQKSGITYVFFITIQESKLIHMILYLWKKQWLCIML